jgi:hypothetical protein
MSMWHDTGEHIGRQYCWRPMFRFRYGNYFLGIYLWKLLSKRVSKWKNYTAFDGLVSFHPVRHISFRPSPSACRRCVHQTRPTMAYGSLDQMGTTPLDASNADQFSQIQPNIGKIWWNRPIWILQSIRFPLNSGDLPEKSTVQKTRIVGWYPGPDKG